jgi:SAM-dependent methyltransferase
MMVGRSARIAGLGRLAESAEDRLRIARSLESLDERFGLARKISDEPETLLIVRELFERVIGAFPRLSLLEGKRILDIACGSRTSRAPFGTARRDDPSAGYTALFEPWLSRILAALGAKPVGVDIGELSGEPFEHYRVDLADAGALDFLPSHSFDAVHDSRLFGSPEFTSRFRSRADVLRTAREIAAQEHRLLKDGGIIIHSDANELAGGVIRDE